MALVGEGVLDSPILASTLEQVPEAELRLEEIRSLPDDRLRFLLWAEERHGPAFEAAVATDDTIESFRLLTGIGDRRLYRLALSEAGREASTYLAAAEQDIVVLDLTVSVDGMRILARVPSREALRRYAEACQQRGVTFRLKRLFEEERAAGHGGEEYGLTESQVEALRRALEMGVLRGAPADVRQRDSRRTGHLGPGRLDAAPAGRAEPAGTHARRRWHLKS